MGPVQALETFSSGSTGRFGTRDTHPHTPRPDKIPAVLDTFPAA